MINSDNIKYISTKFYSHDDGKTAETRFQAMTNRIRRDSGCHQYTLLTTKPLILFTPSELLHDLELKAANTVGEKIIQPNPKGLEAYFKQEVEHSLDLRTDGRLLDGSNLLQLLGVIGE